MSTSMSLSQPEEDSTSGLSISGDLLCPVEEEFDSLPLPMGSAEGLQEFAGASATPTNNDLNTSTHNEGASNNNEGDDSVEQTRPAPEGWYKKYTRWAPTSPALLEESERKILAYIKTGFKGRFVDIGSVERPSSCKWSWSSKAEERMIWTVVFNPSSKNTPLVIVHGLCAAIGLWALNIEGLAATRTVYAIDLLGFGRSSRPSFSSDPSEAEAQHVEAIEAWRKVMGLDRIILLGHSMGGFLSSAYTLKYPQHVAHLALADPWGFPNKPEKFEMAPNPNRNISPRAVKIIAAIGQRINPLATIRVAGPYGPGLIDRVRPDLVKKFEELNQNGSASVAEYIYHCNAQHPTGEQAFRTMMDHFGWAKKAMASRLQDYDSQVPLTFIYGGSTWLSQIPEEELRQILPNDVQLNIHIIPGAGHHLYADDRVMFNGILTECGIQADQILATKSKTINN